MPVYSKRGVEFSVNTAGALTQNVSRLATFADGGFVVVWETSDTAADGSGGAIKAQRFDSAGNKAGGEFLVNSSFATTQSQPTVASFADGSFAVAWTTDDPLQDGAGRAIKARLFTASGLPAGPEFLVNTATAGNQAEPSMTTLANGNFVISWWEAWFGEVHARIFTADGTPLGADFRVNTNTEGLQNSSDVTGLADGGFVVTWRTANSADDGSGDSVKGQVFSASGARVGGEFLVNTNKSGHQNDPAIAALAGGGFVATWVTSQSEDGSGSTLKMQLFSATGAKVGSETRVNSAGVSSQEQPAVTALPDGGFMVAWMTADSAQDGDRQAVKAQVFDSSGARVGSEFLVNTQAYDSQWNPDIATLSDGRVIVTWTDNNAEGSSNWGIKAQIFGPGDPPPPPPPSNWAPVITSDGGGATALRWVDENVTVGARVTAQDYDGQAVIYSIIGGADAALFTIDAQYGTLSFISKPNYEAPHDSDSNGRYEIIVSASDGLASDTQALTIAVADVDENVAFTSSNNIFRSESYTAAYMVTAVQPADPSATITYRIAGGAGSGLFVLNAATGALNFRSQPDFEAPADAGRDNRYDVTVEATDGFTTASQSLMIHILDVDETPVITSGGGGASFSLSIAENQAAVTTISASDPETAPLAYAIAGGVDAARFSIDGQTGALSFVAAPDFETPGDSDGNNIYAVTVSASDGSRSDTQTLFVTVANQNEGPSITSNGGGSTATVSVAENGLTATTVTAADPERTAVAYSIMGGADASRFAIDSTTGVLRFLAGPDFEQPGDFDGNNVYEVVVGASDGVLSSSQSLRVAIGDINEGVTITSGAAVSVIENSTAVMTVTAQDLDGDTVSFAISGGADSALFRVDPQTGALSFLVSPNFEAPADLDGDNVYEVEISAGDGALSGSKALSVTVANEEEAIALVSGGGGDVAAITVNENQAHVLSLLAVDPDGSTPRYSIMGGADAAAFYVDPLTQSLRFHSLSGGDVRPDFETPRDSDGDNVYEVIVAASDGLTFDYQTLSVTVANLYEGLGFAPSAAFSAQEGSEEIGSVSARREAGVSIVYSIAGGPDASLFAIDPITGAISWIGAPDFEGPRDSDSDNIYHFEVTADDGISSESQAVTVTVGNVDEPVEIVSYGGAAAVAVTMVENNFSTGIVVEARDAEDAEVVYAITGGADGDSFEIDPSTGALSFRQPNAPDFEDPTDFDSDRVHEVTVTASSSTSSATQAFMITIVDGNDAPWFATSADLAVSEGSQEVATLVARDVDGDVPSYAIVGGADAALFAIDASSGLLTFVEARDYEAPLSAAGSNVYTVEIEARDGRDSSRETFQVTVGNVDEPVKIVSYGGAATVAVSMMEDDFATGIVVQARDEEETAVSYAITGGADGHSFRIDPSTGALSFVEPNAPDFEDPTDFDSDNVHEVTVTASSSTSSATQTFLISITNRNEAPWLYGDPDLLVDEGQAEVATVHAYDRDGDVLAYAIVGGPDSGLFTLDPATGLLKFIEARDYESPLSAAGTNVYTLEIEAGDGEYASRRSFQVTIRNVNEGLAITSGGGSAAFALTAAENGTAVTTVAASDADGDPVTYSIVGGADSSRFAIDAQSGALSFVQAPDFEAPSDSGADNVYEVIVRASDGTFAESQTLAVTVSNRLEPVVIISNGGGPGAALAVAENASAVATIAAANPDGGTLVYAIVGGADSARFTIDPASGALAFLAAPNFEAPADSGANNVYDVIVSASNGSSSDSQALAVTVGNVDEPVTITSSGGGSSASVARTENGTAVVVLAAGDPDGGAVTYAIAGGADSSRFRIDAATGALAFIAAPDFEAPGDAGGDNVYDVVVSASDGSFVDTQAIAVAVHNVNEAPVVLSGGGGASAVFSVAENSLAVATLVAKDPDGTAPTYSIVGGADSARFTINAQTGVLQFVAAPDWEMPSDSNGDNVYAVVVRASDGQLADDQTLTVTVTNIRDGNTVTGTSGGDSISATSTAVALRTSNEEDLVFGRDGHDTIQGMAGDDELYGEGGNDTLTGGAGADRLSGGLGKDQFTYNDLSDSTAASPDMIMDFSRSQGDRISLGAIDANSLAGNNQAFTFIGTAAFSNVAGQLRYETSAGITTIFGDVNGDGVADLVIQLSGSVPLIASDFLL
jgi:hypothetical protein